MKYFGFELIFYYPIAIGITVNYKSRGGEWAAPYWSDRIFICEDCLLLVQCATAVVKSEKHSEIRNRYLRLKKRRGHKKAIIAIARMLLTAIYNILKKKEPYNAELYRKSDALPVNREITVEQAILLAKTQVYHIMAAS